ncbi:MAG: ribonuclease D [Coriobacteriales bacterium]|jgi:ribonuclease D|nr:ribonuclease D [Coriobacteriales bacterium]
MTIQQTQPLKTIQDNQTLTEHIKQLSQASVLAVDTEFMREKTFTAQLCLLQIASDQLELLIDPLAGLDLEPLAALFSNQHIVKVFHAGSQDLEILFNTLGLPVAPIFDTQIAATLLGLPQQISLAGLIQHYLGIEIKKTDTYSDWNKRPLRAAQLEYALDDVRYLLPIYQTMQRELLQAGRLDWLDEDFKALSDPQRFIETPEKLWQRLKGTTNLSRRQLGVLQELAIWRDKVARQRDLPRKWIVTDEQLVDICRRNPSNIDELYQTRGLSDRVSRRSAQELLVAVQRGHQIPESALPDRPKKSLQTQELTSALNLMQALVHLRASEHHIATNLLASQNDLRALAAGQRSDLDILSGWRKEMIGNELLELLAGTLTLSLNKGHLIVEKTAQFNSVG